MCRHDTVILLFMSAITSAFAECRRELERLNTLTTLPTPHPPPPPPNRFIPWNSLFTQQILLPFVYHFDSYFLNLIDMCSKNEITKTLYVLKKNMKNLYSFFGKVWLCFQFLLKKLLLTISYLQILQSSSSFYFSVLTHIKM